MQQIVTIIVSPKDASSENLYLPVIAQQLGIDKTRINFTRITKKSIDARHGVAKYNLTIQVFIDEDAPTDSYTKFNYQFVGNNEPIAIIGAGPAGLFAALRLIELGLKPVVFERGKEVFERKKDVALISREQKVDTDSNYCFGEGGAGTFSDGKLYTRSSKRGNIQRIFENFHYHGAQVEILFEAHPHIGTDILPEVIKNMRKTILQAGGEIHFNSRIDNLIIESGTIRAIVLKDNSVIKFKAVVLATGHSARDIYKILQNANVQMEAKQFAMGVRVEHPQALINKIQYRNVKSDEYLPAATFNLAEQVNGRGVFSFCMCPGGFILPSATANDQVVVNGMSPSKRNSPFANAGIVMEVKTEDYSSFNEYGPLAGIYYQEFIENMAWQNAGRSQAAPGQRLMDFVNKKMSSDLPKCSYFPGTISSPIHLWLPDIISTSLRDGFKKFDQKMHGFLTNEAIILGVESRTSSPVRVVRDAETMESVSVKGLFPCGEGSGYSGGITSSAMDGENCAEQVALFLSK